METCAGLHIIGVRRGRQLGTTQENNNNAYRRGARDQTGEKSEANRTPRVGWVFEHLLRFDGFARGSGRPPAALRRLVVAMVSFSPSGGHDTPAVAGGRTSTRAAVRTVSVDDEVCSLLTTAVSIARVAYKIQISNRCPCTFFV